LGYSSVRICIYCGSQTTYTDKRNNAHWYDHDGWYCEKCNNKLFKNPKWHPITRKRKLNFRGKWTYVGKNPRTGRCSKCGKTVGDIYINKFGKEAILKHTHMHHVQYHDDDPLKDTIELCQSCHLRETWRLQRLKVANTSHLQR
jgi:DNA-directed RNA polymerase subunit RPC12/RpoP